MKRYFNITGACNPKYHYMVNIQPHLEKIKELIDRGAYFTINRARQYGKTTTLSALKNYLQPAYTVVSVDFQMLSHANFRTEESFVKAFSREILTSVRNIKKVPDGIKNQLEDFISAADDADLGALFFCLSDWCRQSETPVVLLIDEVDSATNNQVFLDFLSQLRGYYIHREDRAAFQSVVLAGVYDVKNIKYKASIQGESVRKNSPWNIATDFMVNMNFTADSIEGMLKEYAMDHTMKMDAAVIAGMIYDYTSGYPFLVSRICKIIDENLTETENYLERRQAWTKEGVLEAVKILLSEKNTLFESLTNKLNDYPKLREMLFSLLFTGKNIVYNPDDEAIDMAAMFGFVKNENGSVVVANRIFEMRLYNMFLAFNDAQSSKLYKAAIQDKNQFVCQGHLDMERVLEKFVIHFDELYGDCPDSFKEEDGRRYFLLYLRPIINGVGNYYIESRTRNMERTDVIVDYQGEQFVVELKIWHGDKYHERGEEQLNEYLNHYHLKKGYMLSFNFNKKKEIGVKHICIKDKILVEAIV